MKRLSLLFVSALVMSATSFAAKKNASVESSMWNWNVNTSKLSECLQLGSDQFDEVKMIGEYFSDKLAEAARGKNDAQKHKLVRYAVNANLKLMKQTLNDKQYRKYVSLLNLTLIHKGLDVYLDK